MKIGIFLLKALLREVDDKAAGLFDHVMRKARRDDANHDHHRVETGICRKTDDERVVASILIPAGNDRLGNGLHTKNRIGSEFFHGNSLLVCVENIIAEPWNPASTIF